MRKVISVACILAAAGCVSRIEKIGDLGDGGETWGGPTETSDNPNGPSQSACLLEYNRALLSEGESACCYRQGEKSSCDPTRVCNERSGDGCCVLYATSSVPTGAGCCLYADGRNPNSATGEDVTSECQALITGSSSSPNPNSGSCLIEYNPALVASGESTCCYRKGGTNSCDPTRACNARSGAGCCVLYGTSLAQTGANCCLHANGTPPRSAFGEDLTAECQALIAEGR